MIKPVRQLSLGVCAAVGAAAAYVIATQQLDKSVPDESPPSQGIAWESELTSPAELAPAVPIDDTDVFIAPVNEAPSIEPRVASATDDDLTSNERYSAFTGATLPVDAPKLVPVQVPDTSAVITANYAVEGNRWNESPDDDSSCATNIVEDTYVIPEMAATPRVFQPIDAIAVEAEPEIEETSQPYVVRNPHNARPVLTLRLGRAVTSRIAQLGPESGFEAPQRVARTETPQASLFVDVDEHNLVCTIDAQHVDLRELLTLVGQRAGIPIHSTQHVEGLVSAQIKDVRLEDAVQRIITPLGFSAGVSDGALIVGLQNEVGGLDRRLNGYDVGQRRITGRRQAVRLVSHQAITAPSSDAIGTDRVALGGVAATGDVEAISVQDGQPLPLHAVPETVMPAESRPAQPTASSPRRLPKVSDRGLPLRAASVKNEDKVFTVIADRALTMMRDGQYRRTVEMLSQLVGDHGRSAQLFALLGEAYFHCGEHRAAEVSLTRSLELYRNDARANYFMGCTFRALGNRQRGQHYLLQAHHLDPMYPPAVNAQALAPR